MHVHSIQYTELIIVALGASVVGAGGVLLYQQYLNDRNRCLLQKEIEQLGSCVTEIRKDLDTVRLALERNIHMSHRNIRQVTGVASTTTDAETEMFSTMGGDDFCDEFYELSSENENVAEEANSLSFEEIDFLLDGSSKEDKTKAYGILLEMLEKEDNNDEVLWRVAKACHMMSSIYGVEGNNEKKSEFIHKGADFGAKAIALNDSNWRAHKWFAICVGERGQFKGVKDKLSDGNLFKKHVDKALSLYTEDALLHHLLGRFYYEIATLSWLERNVANTLFGTVPEGSYKDAIDSLLKADKLFTTAWKSNRLLMAKCYAALKDYKQTLQWLDLAKEAPVKDAEDQVAEKEVNELLKKFNSYRSKQT